MPTTLLKLKVNILFPSTVCPKHVPNMRCSLHLQKLSANSSNIPLIWGGGIINICTMGVHLHTLLL